MKPFIAITFTDDTYGVMDSCINSLIQSGVKKDIYVFDATKHGVSGEIKSFFRAYNKYKVFLIRVKAAKNIDTPNGRINRAILEAIFTFKSKANYSNFIHVSPNIFFRGHDLQILNDNAGIYHCLSPVIENSLRLEIRDGISDRYGYNSFSKDLSMLSYITGQVEETFAINYKCFALSRSYTNKIGKMWECYDHPNDFVSSVLFEYGKILPKVDTNTFVHENLY